MSFFNKKDIFVFITIFSVGTILGIIGTVSFPIGTNMSYFWPAATVQSVCGVFFGMWGVMAGALFPSFSNAMTDGTTSHIVWLIPANFIQSFIPLYIKQIFKFLPYELNRKTVYSFIFGCAILSHVLGGMLGCVSLYIMGDVHNQAEFMTTLKTWLIGNIPCSIVFGILLLKTVGPILKDCNLYYEGYFR